MPIRITINGRTYDGVGQMPPDVRRSYEEMLRQLGPALADRDGNGVLDIVEGKEASGMVVENRIVVNGRSFASVNEMPADVRRLYEEAMRQAGPGSLATSTSRFDVTFGLNPGSKGVGDPGRAAREFRPIEPTVTFSATGMAITALALIVVAATVAFVLLAGR